MIYLIRHGEPAVSGVLLGRLDPPLVTIPGPSNLQVRSVFASPLRRAYETASALFPAVKIAVLSELAEISLGEWDGLTWSEIERRDPEGAARKLENWFTVTPPGGEEFAEMPADIF